MGDFNVVLGSHERSRGTSRHSRPSEEFREFIDDAHLLDIESSGSLFTWFTRQSSSGYMAARLDKALVYQGFLDLWHSLEVTVLTRHSSDHHPLLVTIVESLTTTGLMPFHFLAMWTSHNSFLNVVRQSWCLLITGPNPIRTAMKKLKRLKICLKS
ncbi:hypothetical protein ACS0TY_033691 [Phlomoides rotata]